MTKKTRDFNTPQNRTLRLPQQFWPYRQKTQRHHCYRQMVIQYSVHLKHQHA